MKSLIEYIKSDKSYLISLSEKLVINKDYTNPSSKYDSIVDKIINYEWTEERTGYGTGRVDNGQEVYASENCDIFFDTIISPILDKAKKITSSTAIRRYNPARNRFKPTLIVHSKGTFGVFLILGADANNDLEQYWINVTNKNNIRFEGYFNSNGASIRSLRSYLEKDECYSITDEDFRLINYAFEKIKENAI